MLPIILLHVLPLVKCGQRTEFVRDWRCPQVRVFAQQSLLQPFQREIVVQTLQSAPV